MTTELERAQARDARRRERAAMTPEQRAAVGARRRERESSPEFLAHRRDLKASKTERYLTQEQVERSRERARLYARARRANWTPEERAAAYAVNKLNNRERRASIRPVDSTMAVEVKCHSCGMTLPREDTRAHVIWHERRGESAMWEKTP